eukprot:COSAG05_NODE_1059_length_6003_cov_3.124492_2_plen_78_part_00
MNNLELRVGGGHRVRAGACTNVFSPKGNPLKTKKTKRVKLSTEGGRKVTICKADKTDSDSSDEDYRVGRKYTSDDSE